MAEKPTPPAPLVRGETDTPAPDKGRAGEGLNSGEGLHFIPYNKSLTALARENRQNPTPAESAIWNQVLRHRQFSGYKFLRQKPLGNYIVDFYCAELLLVIEIDGDSHALQIEYDAQRSRFLCGFGLRVIRYTNQEILQNLAGVFDDLQRHIEATPRSRGSQ